MGGTTHDEGRTDSYRDEPRGGRVVAMWEGGLRTVALPVTGELRVGRGADCEVRIEHGSVSRRHAVLRVGPMVTIEDLGSQNGTRVDGRRIASGQRVEVMGSALLEIGAAILVVQAPGQRSWGGRGVSMGRAVQLVDMVASGQLGVLLVGETGVGKDVLAERLHARSPRSGRPLVRVNCASLAEAQLEVELFGVEAKPGEGRRGGAREGVLESSKGGTVLLDEIGDLPMALQGRLLRAIEGREVTRVGGVRTRPVDVRFVATTHRDVNGLVNSGVLRADLLYRLAGVTVWVPPLRERREEIERLANEFVIEVAGRMGREAPVLGRQAVGWLVQQPWPGNVRELRNTIECAVLLSEGGVIGVQHFPQVGRAARDQGGAGADDRPLRDELEATEKARLIEALAACNGNQTRAAEVLGISRRMLLYRIESYGLPRPRKRGN